MSESSSDREIRTLSTESRRAVGSAIIEGLMNPVAIGFERLATEGGDYDQGQGDYNQGGGGGHNQSGGGYNQHATAITDIVDIEVVSKLLQTKLP